MKKRIKYFLGIVGLFLIIASICWYILIDVPENKMKQKSDYLISQIEAFKSKYRHYPKSLDEMGISENEIGPFYNLIDSSEYQIWFGLTGVGESAIYSSKEKVWIRD
ncbi:MAG: hypothetical protein RL757_2368 [Bacteroidota bacterium]|jgi:hypothetical protein